MFQFRKVNLNLRFVLFYCLFALAVFGLLLVFRSIVISNLRKVYDDKTVNESREFTRILSLKQSRIESYNYDYTYWDEFVHYVNHPDTGWINENIVYTMPAFDCKASLVTNSLNEVLFNYSSIKDFDLQEALEKSFAFESPIQKQNWFRDFYVAQNGKVWEIHQAPIQPSNDIPRVTSPYGFFYVANVIDSDYLNQLKLLTGSSTKINFDFEGKDSIENNGAGNFIIRTPLKDINKKTIAVVEMTYGTQAINSFEDSFYNFIVWLILFLLLASGFVSYFMWRWLARPVHLITESLEHHSLQPLNEIRSNDLEFNRLKKLIEDYFNQEKDLLQSKEKAESADKAKSNFLAIVSHEMRTPLHSIIGNADLLSKSNLPGLQQQFNESIKVNGELLLDVINDILDFAKLESGKFDLKNEEFNLSKMIDELVEIFRLECIKKNLTLVYFFDADLPVHIYTDPLRLRQVLVNLINNSIKFTNSGGVELKISKHTINGTVQIKFEVKDSGIGMTEEEKAKIFKPFEQTENFINRKKSGTGLGLSISKKLVEMLGGEIDCESAPGVGSVFSFTITPQFTSESLAKTIAVPSGSTNDVIIIHPDPTIRCNLSKLMTLWKLPFKVYENFNTAKAVGKESLVCIMDESVIDDLTKFEMIDKWKSNRKPLVFLAGTNHILLEQAVQSLNLNGKVVYTPFRHYDLFHTINDFINPPLNITANTNSDVQSGNSNLKVLVAEDNKVNQELMKHFLKPFGVTPSFAINGIEAIEKIKTESFDVVLMDISMPLLDGIETTRQIRQNTSLHQPYIVGISAHAYNVEMENALQSGMNEYLVKPITFELFETKMKEWIEICRVAKNKSTTH